MHLFLFFLLVHLRGALALDGLQGTAETISDTLHTLFLRQTNFNILQDQYANLSASGSVRSVEGAEVIRNIAKTLAEDFEELKASLLQSLSDADSLYSDHYNTNCCSESCTRGEESFNTTACNEDCRSDNVSSYYRTQYWENGYRTEFWGLELDSSPALCRNVSLNESAVHIPLNIFENDSSVLCFIQWTNNLTAHFQKQWETIEGKASFQYIGTSTGLLRFYPASDWSLLNRCDRCLKTYPPVDSYDARSRPWYLNTVSGTKFVVILLDMSGSMTGYRSLLARSAAVELLRSLTPNDYFQIILVRDTVDVLDCFPGKIHASPENILLVSTIIMDMDDTNNQAMFKPALDMAFQALNNSTECHRTLVIFSDAEETLPELNNSLKEVRVFPYLIGRGRDRRAFQSIACDNRGVMNHIQDYSDIIPKIRSFTDELRRQTPANLSRDDVFWTHYRDVFGGMVLSGSLPLIRDTNGTGEFVGVMGVDVKPQTIETRINQHILGPLGYGFVVDNNGQLIVHPLIDRDYLMKLSSDDLISLDVSNFEHTYTESDFTSVRQQLLNRSTGQQTLVAWLPVERGQHYILTNVTYFYAPIEDTPYSVAVVLPSNENDVFQYPNVTMTMVEELDRMGELDVLGNIYLDNRPYCSGAWSVDPQLHPRRFLVDLIQELTSGTSPLADCNPSLYTPLLSELHYIKQLCDRLEEDEEDGDERTACDRVVIQFSSGLTWCLLRDTSLFQCSSQLPLIQLVVGSVSSDLLFYTDSATGTVIATRALQVTNSNTNTTVGAVGTVFTNDTIHDLLENTTAQYNSSEDDGNYTFFLLDGSGYIVASTATNHEFGKPMADVHPEVVCQLVEDGVYDTTTIIGYELKPCELEQNLEPEPCRESDASSVHRGLLISLVGWIQWTLSGGLWTTIRLVMLSFLSFTGRSVGQMEGEGTNCSVKLCLQQTTVYYLQDDSGGSNGSIICSDGTILSYFAVPLPRTSGLLVAISDTCTNVANTTRSGETPIPCPCTSMEHDRQRSPPPWTACHDNTSFVPSSQCSGAISIDNSYSAIFITMATVIMLPWQH